MDGYYHTQETAKEYIQMAKDVSGIKLIEQIIPFVSASCTVLELGTGPGTDFEILSKNFEVTGSDYSLEFLKILKKKFPEKDFLHLDARTLTTEKSFHLIYSNKVLHHLTDNELMASIKRQYELLDGEGWIAHSFWLGEGSETFKGMFVNYHTKNELENTFLKAFEIIFMNDYQEFEPNDSIFILAKKKI